MDDFFNVQYGSIKIKLKDIVDARGISNRQLAFAAQMQRSQLKAYLDNNVTRFDADVLARLCTVLDCQISDILNSFHQKKINKKNGLPQLRE